MQFEQHTTFFIFFNQEMFGNIEWSLIYIFSYIGYVYCDFSKGLGKHEKHLDLDRHG